MSEPVRRRVLDAYQAALPVSLIATPRREFVTCSLTEVVAEALGRNREDQFDHLPVRDAATGAIIGVLPVLETPPHLHGRRVADCYRTLHEDLLIGADVGILDFIREAQQRPFRFIVDGQHIAGLVCLSDIQRLPVRAALFAMVTQLEMSMARIISFAFPGIAWQTRLSHGRQRKLDRQLKLARSDGNQVDPLLYTQFCDKIALLKALPENLARGLESSHIDRWREPLEDLRNRLAHGNDLATTRDEARQVCQLVHLMDDWLERLESPAIQSAEPERPAR